MRNRGCPTSLALAHRLTVPLFVSAALDITPLAWLYINNQLTLVLIIS